ncbi:MAG: GNAT family N-acetyltransferase [Eubacteriales bacterium]|nr:GNAT family N-acetyltransferase [Eubacteriales bacterium]MDD3880696.1 GNAT family N-acetyltransferase [Eubacteriales bacterium]MDD4511670.1 GNAT family N-acetyltransferase [Eubacteriales bacterium]
MVIRKADYKDAKAIAPLVAGFRRELGALKGIESAESLENAESEIRGYLDDGYPVFCAGSESDPIGYIVCRVQEPCVWVESIFVREDKRRLGVASALYEKAEELARKYGDETPYNYVHPNNNAMIAFLHSKGYNVLNLIEIRKPYKGERLRETIEIRGNSFDY